MIDHLALLLAIVAQNAYYLIFHFLGHWGGLDLRVEMAIVNPHIAKGLRAERALVLVLAQIGKAGLVEGVTTGR